MKTFEEICNETEEQSKINNELICKKIITELEKIYHIKFPVFQYNITYSIFLQILLFSPDYMEYRDTLLGLLEKYNPNMRNIVFRFLGIVNQELMLDSERRITENAFKTLPYCKKFEKLEYGYYIETSDGALEAYRLSKNIYWPSLYENLYNGAYANSCHQAVDWCRYYFPNTEIVTSELPIIFGEIMYHSYFKDESTGEIIDIATNTLYKNNTFDTFYKPKELQRIPSVMLDEYIKTLPKEDNNHCEVLRLALQNKMRI